MTCDAIDHLLLDGKILQLLKEAATKEKGRNMPPFAADVCIGVGGKLQLQASNHVVGVARARSR